MTDLLAYESNILTQFNKTDWQDQAHQGARGLAVPDSPHARLRHRDRLRTRYEPDQVWGYTGSAYSDKTAAASTTAPTTEPGDDLCDGRIGSALRRLGAAVPRALDADAG
jgi:hypothetical protein